MYKIMSYPLAALPYVSVADAVLYLKDMLCGMHSVCTALYIGSNIWHDSANSTCKMLCTCLNHTYTVCMVCMEELAPSYSIAEGNVQHLELQQLKHREINMSALAA